MVAASTHSLSALKVLGMVVSFANREMVFASD